MIQSKITGRFGFVAGDNTGKFSLKANRRFLLLSQESRDTCDERESKQRRTGTQEHRDKTQSIQESRCRK